MNTTTNTSGAYIVSWDFSKEDTGVLIVGQQTKGTMKIINAFQGEEAYDVYKKLTCEKKTEVSNGASGS
jgi:hypothetical protein